LDRIGAQIEPRISRGEILGKFLILLKSGFLQEISEFLQDISPGNLDFFRTNLDFSRICLEIWTSPGHFSRNDTLAV